MKVVDGADEEVSNHILLKEARRKFERVINAKLGILMETSDDSHYQATFEGFYKFISVIRVAVSEYLLLGSISLCEDNTESAAKAKWLPL